MQQLKKYLAVLLLLLFLFPLAEKELHAYEYKNEFHCSATDKHLHELEHTCSICEFTITNVNSFSATNYQFLISVQQFLFAPFAESLNTPKAFQDLTARAPPVA
ncbi:MAG: hypothetical protein H0W84_04565 [Bacteroidetes bacterium]|nr:hypothetical protein [Bacteroidota bacterium]